MSDTGTCEFCGAPNSVRPGRKYCSQSCYGAAKRAATLHPCARCGEPTAGSRRKFCSRDCAARGQEDRVSRTCERCGETFTVPRSASGAKYCGKSCKYIAHTKAPMECARCGQLIPRKRLANGLYKSRSTTCPACQWAALTDEERADICARATARAAQLNAASRPTAHHHGYQWTGPELELVVSRTDLSVAELAGLLGRTHSAVIKARAKARRDPKWISVAGVTGGDS